MWSLEELEKCRAELYPAVHPDVMKKRYTEFGGVVRYVLEQQDFLFKDLLQRLTRGAADELLHLDLENARSQVAHSLAHAQVSNLPHWMVGPPIAVSWGCRVHSSGSAVCYT